MATLDAEIDRLYSGSLSEFVSARTELARTLGKDDARAVRKLVKPTVVPWAVNQVYWRARPIFDRMLKAGAHLRDAQVAALEGRATDVRAAEDAHRRALGDAVKRAEDIASIEDVHPPADVLLRTLEAISLRPEGGEAFGRLTKPLSPAGFEALAGIRVAASAASAHTSPSSRAAEPTAAERAKLRKEEAARKRDEAEVAKAEAAVERARRRAAEAEAALKQLRDRSR